MHCDGVGGQKSMGFESYEGAIGEYMFACSGTGSKKVKLYSSNEQFPILLYHFLSQIEADRFRCRKIYVDTYSVNLSAEAHEVAAAFYTVLVPVSAGSPQELAFAESAHRVIAASSRAMILNAPHMPKFCCLVYGRPVQCLHERFSAAEASRLQIPLFPENRESY